MEDYKKVEDALNEKHLEVKSVYERFKALLEDVKRKESLKSDLEKLDDANRECEAQISKVETQLKAHMRVNNRIDINIFKRAKLLPDATKDLLYRVRRRCQARSREDTDFKGLVQLFREADTDCDGLVSPTQILTVFEKTGVNVSPNEITLLMQEFDVGESPRFLDICAMIGLQAVRTEGDDETAFLSGISDIDVEDLRICMKKTGVTYNDFRDRLLRFERFQDVKEFFERGMEGKDKDKKWPRIWETFGAGTILMRVHSWI